MNIQDLKNIISNNINKNEYIDFFQKAVSFESITGNEKNFVEFLFKKMNSLNLNPQIEDFKPGRPNIWGSCIGEKKDNIKTLLFIGHTDTVHVDGWENYWKDDQRKNPFSGALIDNKIWGRGSGDLKAGICASLLALDLLKKHKIKLNGNVQYAFVGDEESGQETKAESAGIKKYVSNIESGKITKPNFAIYTEPSQLDIFTAQMGFYILDILIIGKSSYFGVPHEGNDAIKASHNILSNIWEYSKEIAKINKHDLVGESFALVTEIKGGGFIAVPGECKLSLIRKLIPGEPFDKSVKELEEIILTSAKKNNVKIEFNYPAGRDHEFGGSSTEVDQSSSEIKLLSEIIQSSEFDKGKIKGAPFWSESTFLVNKINCPTVYCAPGDIKNCHTYEESVDQNEYLAAIISYAIFIAMYCGISNESRK
jgi:acetylornithine deacetylase/succinyl-diaminopimelate desuccinylase-like protein